MKLIKHCRKDKKPTARTKQYPRATPLTTEKMDPQPTTERRLQPLRIPSGFKIEWNEFYGYDPSTEYDEKDHLHYLTEELLQLKYHQEE